MPLDTGSDRVYSVGATRYGGNTKRPLPPGHREGPRHQAEGYGRAEHTKQGSYERACTCRYRYVRPADPDPDG